jgi:hypothetical protein
MYDPDLHTWDDDTARLERDAEVDSSVDHYATVWFGYRGGDTDFFSSPACGCGATFQTTAVLVAHLRKKLNP